jgi:hypothetical protein
VAGEFSRVAAFDSPVFEERARDVCAVPGRDDGLYAALTRRRGDVEPLDGRPAVRVRILRVEVLVFLPAVFVRLEHRVAAERPEVLAVVAGRGDDPVGEDVAAVLRLDREAGRHVRKVSTSMPAGKPG